MKEIHECAVPGSWSLAVVLLAVISTGCSQPPPIPDLGLIPEVAAFLQDHADFGQAVASQAVPDWANGKRQRVSLDSGRSLLFYTKAGRVVTVYEDSAGTDRKIVWGLTEEYVAPTQSTAAELPDHKVLFSVQKFGGGGRLGEVLIPSLSRMTPVKLREEIARKLASKEGFIEVSLYSTEEAYEANSSAVFAKAHPDAMKRGFLGTLKDGTFDPGEALYP